MSKINISKNQAYYRVQAWSLLILVSLILNTSLVYANGVVISSCDKIPSDYSGKIFKIKTDYPAEISNQERP